MRMTCREAEDFLTGRRGDPSLDEMGAFEAHIASCAACAARRIEEDAAWSLLDRYEAPEPLPGFEARFRERLAERESGKKKAGIAEWLRSLFPSIPAWGPTIWVPAGALALILLFVIGRAVIPTGEAPIEAPVNGTEIVASMDMELLEQEEMLRDLDVIEDMDILLTLEEMEGGDAG